MNAETFNGLMKQVSRLTLRQRELLRKRLDEVDGQLAKGWPSLSRKVWPSRVAPRTARAPLFTCMVKSMACSATVAKHATAPSTH